MKQEIGQQKTADVLVKKIFYITGKTKRKLISKFAAIWQKHFSCNAETVQFELLYTVESRFNKNARGTGKTGSFYRKPRFNEFAWKQPSCSLNRRLDDNFFYFFKIIIIFLWCDVTLLCIFVIVFRRYCVTIRFSCTTELSQKAQQQWGKNSFVETTRQWKRKLVTIS